MNMLIVICKDNAGFEDQLTVGRVYDLHKANDGSYLISNDQWKKRWYGTMHFNFPEVDQ